MLQHIVWAVVLLDGLNAIGSDPYNAVAEKEILRLRRECVKVDLDVVQAVFAGQDDLVDAENASRSTSMLSRFFSDSRLICFERWMEFSRVTL